MHIAIVSDSYLPIKSSAAEQIRDLAQQFTMDGHSVTVLISDPTIESGCLFSYDRLVRLVRLKAGANRSNSYLIRFTQEIIMPILMYYYYLRHSKPDTKFDLVIWYSPSIFLAPFVYLFSLKYKINYRYLILRDIFPLWALEVGIITKNIPYYFLRVFELFQYKIATVIAVQSEGDLTHFSNKSKYPPEKLVVLNNWLGNPSRVKCSIDISQTSLKGRSIFLYAGNMGVAQDVTFIIDIAILLKDVSEIGFVFIGYGSDLQKLKNLAKNHKLTNVLFFDAIDAEEINALYQQCTAGIVALNLKHKTNNIPGKFISYMRGSLPVVARVNVTNDIKKTISKHNVGIILQDNDATLQAKAMVSFIKSLRDDKSYYARCERLFKEQYQVENITKKITNTVKNF